MAHTEPTHLYAWAMNGLSFTEALSMRQNIKSNRS